MIKLCIFDMDGTVLNTINSIAYFGNGALNKFSLPSIPTDRYKLLVGDGARVLVERMIKEVDGTLEDIEKVLPEYSANYDNDFLYLTEAYEGVLDMLAELKALGIKTAILTNKPDETAQKVCQVIFGSDLVDLCIGGREGIPLKPAPDGVFEILNHFKVSKEECLYIGDTATDIKTAKNANLTSIGVLWGFRDRNELEGAGADYIIEKPEEIVEIAKK